MTFFKKLSIFHHFKGSYLSYLFPMFIGIIGPKSSGKHTIAEYLVNRHGFEFLTIRKNLDVYNRDVYSNARYFDNIDNMQVYVTERWQDNFITCDIDCKDLDMLRYGLYLSWPLFS